MKRLILHLLLNLFLLLNSFSVLGVTAEEYLKSLDVIRMAFVSGIGNGHQAISFNIIRRLRELGFKGKIELLIPSDEFEKISNIVPSFDSSKNSQKLKGFGIEVEAIEAMHFLIHQYKYKLVDLAIIPAFGLDKTDTARATLRRIKMARVSSADLRTTKTLFLHPTGHFDSQIEEDGKIKQIYGTKKMAFKINMPPSENVSLQDIEGAWFRKDDPRADYFKRILSDPNIDSSVLYGLSYHNGPEKIAFYIRNLAKAQKLRPDLFNKPIVLTQISRPSAFRVEDEIYETIAKPEYQSRIVLLNADDPKWKDPGLVLDPTKIYLVRTGPISQDLFHFMTAYADFAPTMAGVNTQDLMRTEGRPYVVSYDIENYNLRKYGLSGNSLQIFQHASMSLQRDWGSELSPALYNYLIDSKDLNSGLRHDFELLSKHALQEADKLQVALDYLISENRDSWIKARIKMLLSTCGLAAP